MAARILVVEDTPDIIEVVQIILTRAGYEVVTVTAPIFDRNEIERIKPDLVFLDCLFGGKLLGIEMLRLLKTWPTTRQIPVIVSSALTKEALSSIESYLRRGDVWWLPRPFSNEELVQTVRQLLGAEAAPGTTKQGGADEARW